MIKAVIFDIDNTLMDFMRMKRASVDAAVDAMLDAGLSMKKEKMYESIFETYWKEGIEDQNIFDKVLVMAKETEGGAGCCSGNFGLRCLRHQLARTFHTLLLSAATECSNILAAVATVWSVRASGR